MLADLPDHITVYADHGSVGIYGEGLPGRRLPIANSYAGPGGCYVAVYSHKPGVYPVGAFSVHGLIRVKGGYDATGIARPAGYEQLDISASREFKDLAAKVFPATHGDAWVGGDTGGFLDVLKP